MLPNDIARCEGATIIKKGAIKWCECCVDCQRRIAERSLDYILYMMPPDIIDGKCEYRIEP